VHAWLRVTPLSQERNADCSDFHRCGTFPQINVTLSRVTEETAVIGERSGRRPLTCGTRVREMSD
jgi:hypothetical protein